MNDDKPISNGSFGRLADKVDGGTVRMKPGDFVPSPGMILVKILPPEETTKGGLIIPDSIREERRAGHVLAVNPSDEKQGCPYGVKDLVVIRAMGGEAIPFEDCEDRYRVIAWSNDGTSDILGSFPFDPAQNVG